MGTIKFTEKTIKPIGEEYEIDFNGKPVMVHDFEVTEAGDVTRVEYGMTFKSIADLLGYSKPGNVGNLVRRELEDFADHLYNPNEIGLPRTKVTKKSAIYLVGQGIDIFMMFTKKPLGKIFRRWLAPRSLDLRTKGAALANERIPELKCIVDDSPINVGLRVQEDGALETQGVLLALLTNIHTSNLKAEEERKKNAEVAKRAESAADKNSGKVDYLQKQLDHIHKCKDDAIIKYGEIGKMALARKVKIYSESGKPHGGSMGLIWLNYELDAMGLTRNIMKDVGHDKPYEVEILTKEGHEYFMENVLPEIPFGLSKVSPNLHSRTLGATKSYTIYRVEIESI